MDEPRPVAILAALREEMAPIERRLSNRREVSAPGGSYTAGTIDARPVALLRTGIGVQAARSAADWLIRAVSPSAVVALGFAGGLRDDLRPGDLVLAREVFEPPPPDGEGPREWESDPDLFASVRKVLEADIVEGTGEGGKSRKPRLAEGRIATVRRALATAAEKRAFAERHGAIAVDMESSGIARAANVHDARVVYLRAVVDEAGFDLPLDFTRILTPDGRLKPLGTLGALLRRPAAIKALGELRGRALLGAENLAACVGRLIAVLASE